MSTLSSRLRKSPTRPNPAAAIDIVAGMDRLDVGQVPAEEPVVLCCSAPRESAVRPPRDVFVDAPYRRRRTGRVASLARTWRDAARTPASSPERGSRGRARTPERASAGPADVERAGASAAGPHLPSASHSPVPPSRPGTASPFGSSPIPVGKGFGKAGLGGVKLDGPGPYRDDNSSQGPRGRRTEVDKHAACTGPSEGLGPNTGLAAGFAGTHQRGPLPFKF